jgi:hypothetical protein
MITQAFGRDEHDFVLKVRGWREVEKTCSAGLAVVARRIEMLDRVILVGLEHYPGGVRGAMAAGLLGDARLDDVREPLLQGLVDGGMTSTEAGMLVRLVFDEDLAHGGAPLIRFAHLAFEILSAAIFGPPGEAPPGEISAPRTPKPRRRSKTGASGSPTSTKPA